jgi:hypothetical protein
MKELWSRTFELFKRHTVLWMPCSIAAILMLALGKLQRAEIRWLLRFFSTQHSVLTGEVPVADLAQAQHRAMMLVYPLGFLKQFLEVCVSVVALAATKNLVQIVLDMIAAVRGVLPRSREVLLFTLKFMAVLAVFGGVLIVLGSSPLTSERIHEFVLSRAFIYVLGLVGQACLAWLLMLPAIRLLRPPGSPAISTEGRRLGTAFAVAASAGTLALEYLVGRAEAVVILDKPWEGDAVAVVNAVVVNAPQVLLFIALALLAIQGAGEGPRLAAEPE